jgi:hypothetical protein
VLVGAHASRDAVHDDADFVGFHVMKFGWPQRGAIGAKIADSLVKGFASFALFCG